MPELQDLVSRLQVIDEELSDLAMARLRASIEGDEHAGKEERRITRARRSVEKATHLLAGPVTEEF